MTRRIPFPNSIRARLAALTLAVALPLGVLIALDYSDRLASRVESAGDSARALASAVAASLGQLVDAERAMLAALAARPSQRVEQPAICDPLIADARMLSPYRANITVSAASGEPVCSAVPLPGGVPLSVLDQDHAQRLLRTGEFSIGEPFRGPITGRWVMPLAYPRRDAVGRLLGWVGAPLDVESIGALLSRSVTDPDDLITVISPQGKVISRSRDVAQWVGTDVSRRPFAPDLLAGKLSVWRSSGLDGTARVWGAAAVPVAGWTVLVGHDEAKVLAPANAELLRNSLVIGSTLLLVVGLSLAISRGIAAPIQAVAQAARDIAAGERERRLPVTGVAEIALIARELNRMLDALERSDAERERLRQVIEQTCDMVTISALDGTLVYANRAARDFLGLRPGDSLAGVRTRQVYSPERWKFIREVARPRAMTAGSWADESFLLAHDGRAIPVSQVLVALRNARGEVESFAGISRDISDSRAAQDRLKESTRRVTGILESMSDAFITFDRQWRYCYVNPRAAAMFGRSAESLLGRKYLEEFPEAAGTPFEQAYRKAMTERVEIMIEAHYAPWNRWFENRIYPTEEGISIFFHEITDRKLAEGALVESEAKLRKLIDGLGPDIFVGLLTPDGVLLEANRPALDAAGLEPHDVIGKPVEKTYWFEWSEMAQHQLRAAISAAAAGETSRRDVQVRVAEEKVIWLDLSLNPLRDEGGRVTALVASAMVIEERKRAELATQESEARFRQLADNIREVFWLTDTAKNAMLYVSPAYEAIWGRTRDSLYALPRTWLDSIHPEDRERVRQAAHAMQVAGKYDDVYRIIRPDGTLRWIHDRATAVHDASGAAYRIAGVAMDITEQRQASEALSESRTSLEALTRRLFEVQETERRTVARELHDEVGGVLIAVKLNLQALRRMQVPDPGDAMLADGLQLVDSAIQVVRSLSLDLRPAVLDDLGLIQALKWYCERQAQRAGIPIELALDAIDLKSAPQLESACFRIVQEAVTNALRHAHARRIQVSLRRGDGSLALEITDDGSGFDVAAARQRGRAGKSSGLLGMAERAELLGGRLAVGSMPGAGTAVRVAFTVPEVDSV